jgi:hypothetical protein
VATIKVIFKNKRQKVFYDAVAKEESRPYSDSRLLIYRLEEGMPERQVAAYNLDEIYSWEEED